MIDILSHKLSLHHIEIKNATLDQLLARVHVNSILGLIGILHQHYYCEFNNGMFVESMETGGSDMLKEYKDNDGKWVPYIKDVNIIQSETKYYKKVYFDLVYFKIKSQIIVNYDCVVIKYKDYDNHAKVNYHDKIQQTECPAFCLRSYMKVNELLYQVSIFKSIKESYLTIDDILFVIGSIEIIYQHFPTKLIYSILNQNDHNILYIKISP